MQTSELVETYGSICDVTPALVGGARERSGENALATTNAGEKSPTERALKSAQK